MSNIAREPYQASQFTIWMLIKSVEQSVNSLDSHPDADDTEYMKDVVKELICELEELITWLKQFGSYTYDSNRCQDMLLKLVGWRTKHTRRLK
jgi:hypothetical protein